jgi:hypothetical protein
LTPRDPLSPETPARANAPPTGGEWRAWSARLRPWLDREHDRTAAAGRCARRRRRELDARWGVLGPHGVAPTPQRAERAWRGGGQWRKRALGTARDPGKRWGERIVARPAPCRLRAVATSHVRGAARTSLGTGPQPHRAWLPEPPRTGAAGRAPGGEAQEALHGGLPGETCHRHGALPSNAGGGQAGRPGGA